MQLLDGITPFNGKSKAKEISLLLDKYIPNVEWMHTQLKKYNVAFTDTTAENAALKKENASLEAALDAGKYESIQKQLHEAQLHREYQQAKALRGRIPKEVSDEYKPLHEFQAEYLENRKALFLFHFPSISTLAVDFLI